MVIQIPFGGQHIKSTGEHGGYPDSVDFSRKAGFDYVSCSPFRVPVAKLAAAQLAIKDKDLQTDVEASL